MARDYLENQKLDYEYDEYEDLDQAEYDENDGVFQKIKGFFSKIGSFLEVGSRDDEDEFDEEVLEEEKAKVSAEPALKATSKLPRYDNSNEIYEADNSAKANQKSNLRIVNITPEVHKDIVFHTSKNVFDNEIIADYLSQGKTCVVRFDEVSDFEFETSYNYLLGAVRATKGFVKEIHDSLYIFSPNESVVISADESINSKFRREVDFNVKIMNIKGYKNSTEVSEYLKSNICVIIKLEEYENTYIDANKELYYTSRDAFQFIQGANHVLEAEMIKLQNFIYLIAPKDIKIMKNNNMKVVVDKKKMTGMGF